MPRDVFKKLRLLLKPMAMCLDLGDNSTHYHVRITGDAPVKVGEIKFDIYNEGGAFKFQPRFEVCNTFNVKYVPHHRRFIKEEPKKKEEPEKKETKIKEVVASVKTKEQSQPVKTKKMTKLKNKSMSKMVRKWVPKIATPTKSVDPK
jgi:predicted nucleotidyltransferase